MPFSAVLSPDAAIVVAGSCTEENPAKAVAATSATPRMRGAIRTVNREQLIAPCLSG